MASMAVLRRDESTTGPVAFGGRTIMPRFSPAPNTWLALVADPEGHVLGLNEA